ncbi:hypothetical protein ACFPU1_16690 [Thalassorhabdus alkalitolerans]|uniref:DUF3828 domain-containing protein n=1 Tax=Thalassorhabdus alkalitolerans TaxID=2282697 RepID=A0ABW0YPI2_9BACI
MKKRLLLLPSSLLFLVACNDENAFDEEEAIEQSQAQLEEFLNTFESQETLAEEQGDIEPVIVATNEHLAEYFTDSFHEKVIKTIEETGHSHYNEGATFFLENDPFERKTVFRNDFSIEVDEVDEDTETVVYYLDSPERSIGQQHSYMVDMIQENGEWKINN